MLFKKLLMNFLKFKKQANKNYQLADIIAKAKRILGQFTLEITQVYWWSIYEIGQRLSSSFDNVPPGSKALPCAFLAGDACHTHSPKAGQVCISTAKLYF